MIEEGRPVVTSKSRRRRYKGEQESPQAAPERPLKTVSRAEPKSAPVAAADENEEINFMLPPGGMMGGNMFDKPKTVKVDGPLNAHVLQFQARYQKQRYKFSRGTIALWRMLLREEWEMQAEARRLEKETGVPAMPRKGLLMSRFEQELDRMDAEASGDIFDD
jgi:hypothetical protein